MIVIILHVLAGGLMLGAAFYSLVIISKKNLSKTDVQLARVISKYGRPLAAVQLVTGVILVGLEPDNFAKNPLIWAKIVLYVASGFIAAALVEKRLNKLEEKPDDTKLAKSTQLGALILVSTLTAIVVLGVIVAATS